MCGRSEERISKDPNTSPRLSSVVLSERSVISSRAMRQFTILTVLVSPAERKVDLRESIKSAERTGKEIRCQVSSSSLLTSIGEGEADEASAQQ